MSIVYAVVRLWLGGTSSAAAIGDLTSPGVPYVESVELTAQRNTCRCDIRPRAEPYQGIEEYTAFATTC